MTEDYIVHSLNIDDEFLLVTPSLSVRDCRALETRLKEGESTEPVYVWNKTILAGYEKYEICVRLNIPFEIEIVPVNNKQQSIVWICKKNLQRDDLNVDIKRFLIGKRNIAEYTLLRDKRYKTVSSLSEEDVRDYLGKEYSLTHDRLNRYRMYARALETLADIVPEIYRKFIDGSIVLPIKPTMRYAKLSTSDIKEIAPHILERPFALTHILREQLDSEMIKPKKPRNKTETAVTIIIPKHDSDAEILSLTCTIPAWTKAIERAMAGINIRRVSKSARAMLTKELSELNTTIKNTIRIVKERTCQKSK